MYEGQPVRSTVRVLGLPERARRKRLRSLLSSILEQEESNSVTTEEDSSSNTFINLLRFARVSCLFV